MPPKPPLLMHSTWSPGRPALAMLPPCEAVLQPRDMECSPPTKALDWYFRHHEDQIGKHGASAYAPAFAYRCGKPVRVNGIPCPLGEATAFDLSARSEDRATTSPQPFTVCPELLAREAVFSTLAVTKATSLRSRLGSNRISSLFIRAVHPKLRLNHYCQRAHLAGFVA
jgi:hypothetical protein